MFDHETMYILDNAIHQDYLPTVKMSKELVRKHHPHWSKKQIDAETIKEYNKAIRLTWSWWPLFAITCYTVYFWFYVGDT